MAMGTMNMTNITHAHTTLSMMNHSGGHGGHGTGGMHGTHSVHGGHGTNDSMGGHMGGGGHVGAGGHSMGGMHSLGHMMYFTFSAKATILFEEWDIDTTKGMVWSCFVVFLLAIIYEGFKVFREVLREKYGNPKSYDVSTSNGHGPVGKSPYDTSVYQSRNRFCNWHHFLQSFLHMIQVALSYFLMLIAMTFNGWLFIAVCVGAGFGYFLFSWKVAKPYDVNEHCH